MTAEIVTSKIDKKVLFSTLWLFVLLNIIFRDIHELITAAFVREILTGVINGTRITDNLLLLSAFLVEIPIAMVVLSRILSRRVNRWANIFASVLTIAAVLSALPGDLDDRFFAIVELATLAAIIRLAWKWRGLKAQSGDQSRNSASATPQSADLSTQPR